MRGVHFLLEGDPPSTQEFRFQLHTPQETCPLSLVTFYCCILTPPGSLSKARRHNPRLTKGQMEPHRWQQCLVLRPWGMLTFHFSSLLLSRFPNMSIVTCRMLENKKSALFLSCLLCHTRRTSAYFVGSRETSGLFRKEIIPSGLGGVPSAVWRCLSRAFTSAMPQKHRGPRRMILQTLWMGSSVRPTQQPLHFRVSLLLLGNPLSDTLAFLPTALPNLPFLSQLCLRSLCR